MPSPPLACAVGDALLAAGSTALVGVALLPLAVSRRRSAPAEIAKKGG